MGGRERGRNGGRGREKREAEKADGRKRTGTREGRGARGEKGAPEGGAMPRVAQEGDRMGDAQP